MEVNVSVDVKSARKSLLQYQKKQLPAATTRALNRTLRGTVTDTKREVAKRINMTQGRIGKVIRKRFASKKQGGSGSQFVAIMMVTGERRKPNIASFISFLPNGNG